MPYGMVIKIMYRLFFEALIAMALLLFGCAQGQYIGHGLNRLYINATKDINFAILTSMSHSNETIEGLRVCSTVSVEKETMYFPDVSMGNV